MIVLSFLGNTIKLILKLPVLLCLGIVYPVVGMIREIYSIFHAFYWVFLALAFFACLVYQDWYGIGTIIVLVPVSVAVVFKLVIQPFWLDYIKQR
jgi:hypothetical protein